MPEAWLKGNFLLFSCVFVLFLSWVLLLLLFVVVVAATCVCVEGVVCVRERQKQTPLPWECRLWCYVVLWCSHSCRWTYLPELSAPSDLSSAASFLHFYFFSALSAILLLLVCLTRSILLPNPHPLGGLCCPSSFSAWESRGGLPVRPYTWIQFPRRCSTVFSDLSHLNIMIFPYGIYSPFITVGDVIFWLLHLCLIHLPTIRLIPHQTPQQLQNVLPHSLASPFLSLYLIFLAPTCQQRTLLQVRKMQWMTRALKQ